MNSRRSFLLDEDLAICIDLCGQVNCRCAKGGMWMFPIILHSCMCVHDIGSDTFGSLLEIV